MRATLGTGSLEEPKGPDTSVQPYKQIILFGDSITQNAGNHDSAYFSAAFQADYIRRVDVINRGLSGYNSRQAKKGLPWIMPTPAQADVVLLTIFFGANDSVQEGLLQHVPLDEYMENLKGIINDPLVTAHKTKVLLITPPPVNENQFFNDDRLAEHTKKYADASKSVAESENVPIVDLWTAVLTKAGWKEGEPLLGKRGVKGGEELEKYFLDGLHFTSAGYGLMYEEVTRVIREKLPDCVNWSFPEVMPPYDKY